MVKWLTGAQLSVKHLGNVVDNSLSDKSDCRSKRTAFIGSANRCIGNYNYHKDCTKRKLWQAYVYCSSFYGSPLWICKSNGFNECCTAWRKGTRRFFNLPYTTHNYLVGPLSGQCSIDETLYIRTLKFIRSILASANPLIAYISIYIIQLRCLSLWLSRFVDRTDVMTCRYNRRTASQPSHVVRQNLQKRKLRVLNPARIHVFYWWYIPG